MSNTWSDVPVVAEGCDRDVEIRRWTTSLLPGPSSCCGPPCVDNDTTRGSHNCDDFSPSSSPSPAGDAEVASPRRHGDSHEEYDTVINGCCRSATPPSPPNMSTLLQHWLLSCVCPSYALASAKSRADRTSSVCFNLLCFPVCCPGSFSFVRIGYGIAGSAGGDVASVCLAPCCCAARQAYTESTLRPAWSSYASHLSNSARPKNRSCFHQTNRSQNKIKRGTLPNPSAVNAVATMVDGSGIGVESSSCPPTPLEAAETRAMIRPSRQPAQYPSIITSSDSFSAVAIASATPTLWTHPPRSLRWQWTEPLGECHDCREMAEACCCPGLLYHRIHRALRITTSSSVHASPRPPSTNASTSKRPLRPVRVHFKKSAGDDDRVTPTQNEYSDGEYHEYPNESVGGGRSGMDADVAAATAVRSSPMPFHQHQHLSAKTHPPMGTAARTNANETKEGSYGEESHHADDGVFSNDMNSPPAAAAAEAHVPLLCVDCACACPCSGYGLVRHALEIGSEYRPNTEYSFCVDGSDACCEDICIGCFFYPCALNRALREISRLQ